MPWAWTGSEWVRTLNLFGGTLTTTADGDQLDGEPDGGTWARSSGTGTHFAVGGGWAINTIATNVASTWARSIRAKNKRTT